MCRIMKKQNARRGMILIMSMIFIAVFTSLSYAMMTMSSRNVKVAGNHRNANRALESAMSGAEIMKYHMSKVEMPGATVDDQRFAEMEADLLANVSLNADNPITLDSSLQKSFSATVAPDPVDSKYFTMTVTGNAGQLSRRIRMTYSFGVREDSVFDYGVATKGPLELSGNILLEGTNISVEADVYIESAGTNAALSIIGNSQIAGDVKITNPDAEVFLQGGQAGIGTDENGDIVTGQEAIDNHVETGVPPTEFPLPNTDYFRQYITGETIDVNTDLATLDTLENVRIAPNTNPFFTGNVDISGVLFIEAPNIVTFAGNCNIAGLIIADGSVDDDSGTSKLMFLGDVQNTSVADLPEEPQFDGLREETGTFLMAPGFSASFGGNFGTLNGAIAANGIEFSGNAGGTIGGSVLNYADTPMILSGNSDLFFNRSGTEELPAGFESEIILHYDPASYDEVVL